MSKTIHLSMSVRGALAWPRAEMQRALAYVTRGDGTAYRSIEELRDALMDELAQGHEKIPMATECAGFDPVTGCPGHEKNDAP